MAKYNYNNDQHRHWLAQNILNILVKWGFALESPDHTWEFVAVRDEQSGNKIIIYTSIDQSSGAMRKNGKDRIRVVLSLSNMPRNISQYPGAPLGDGRWYRRIKRINRVGEFNAITQRLIEGIKMAQKLH